MKCLCTLDAAAARRDCLLGKRRTLGEDVDGPSFFFSFLSFAFAQAPLSPEFEVPWLADVTYHSETLSYKQSEHPVKRLAWGASYRQ